MAKHLYCVTNKDAACPANGAYLVPYRDIALVVKDAPHMDYASLPREILVQCLANHQSLVEGIMKGSTAVPVKFGTLAGDDGDILEILESGYEAFKKFIDDMSGKAEVDVIALWNDLDSVLKEIGRSDEIRRFKDGISGAALEKIREQAIELGRMLRTVLEEENLRVRDEILTSLKEHALEQRIHEHFDDKMLMNVAFLIKREDKNALDERIEELDKRYCGRIDFRIIGPLPPHSFTTLQITRIRADEIEEAMHLLGVKAGADGAEVKARYRRLLRKYHPDKNPDDPSAGRDFERFSRAYKTLADCTIPACGKDAIMVRTV